MNTVKALTVAGSLIGVAGATPSLAGAIGNSGYIPIGGKFAFVWAPAGNKNLFSSSGSQKGVEFILKEKDKNRGGGTKGRLGISFDLGACRKGGDEKIVNEAECGKSVFWAVKSIGKNGTIDGTMSDQGYRGIVMLSNEAWGKALKLTFEKEKKTLKFSLDEGGSKNVGGICVGVSGGLIEFGETGLNLEKCLGEVKPEERWEGGGEKEEQWDGRWHCSWEGKRISEGLRGLYGHETNGMCLTTPRQWAWIRGE